MPPAAAWCPRIIRRGNVGAGHVHRVGGLDELIRRSPDVGRVLRTIGRVSKDLQPDVSKFSIDQAGELCRDTGGSDRGEGGRRGDLD